MRVPEEGELVGREMSYPAYVFAEIIEDILGRGIRPREQPCHMPGEKPRNEDDGK